MINSTLENPTTEC